MFTHLPILRLKLTKLSFLSQQLSFHLLHSVCNGSKGSVCRHCVYCLDSVPDSIEPALPGVFLLGNAVRLLLLNVHGMITQDRSKHVVGG